jgi:hypothetical protein
MNQPSPWTDDERWRTRLAADAERLAALLTEEDREVVDGAVAAADGDGGLDFLVVYGSVARGERRAESDLDIYFEASDCRGSSTVPIPTGVGTCSVSPHPRCSTTSVAGGSSHSI